LEEQVVFMPLVHMTSLIKAGMPVKGLILPLLMDLSASFACSKAIVSVMVTQALTLSSTSASRASVALVSSTEDTFFSFKSW
jgi:hypothetical protein